VKILSIIPARMGSSRFPGKPMALIHGKPMIGHVYESVAKSKSVNDVIVATCDQVIADYIESIGGKAVMTSTLHERASDRCAEALEKYENSQKTKFDIVVMVQGDEPMVVPKMLDQAIAPLLENQQIQVSNLLGDVSSEAEFNDPNCIKVVCDLRGNALYFSRKPIPFYPQGKFLGGKKQICIIPFRRDFLLSYVKLKPTPLEIHESVDMMRILEHGYKVFMQPTDCETFAVDTPKDLEKVSSLMS
jgi:3-deoxy-manno-octulosonate cytidylyltransferase (CMP-KDO synthetase)